jgi:hypothetical protein
MEQACEADNTARERGQPAIHKLQMLPEVVALLNRNTVQHSIVDPDTNFLQSVKFFLEPLNDGSLPAYNIQRDLFAALARLPIEKEALLSSGIGKVVLYYTKSKRPEIGIKRTAERLLGDWSRPILKRSDDYKKRKVSTRDYDVMYEFLLRHSLSNANPTLVLLNSLSVHLPYKLRSLRLLNAPPCPKKTSIESVSLRLLSGATGLEWKHQMPVIAWLQEALSIPVGWTRVQSLSVQVVWMHSGK